MLHDVMIEEVIETSFSGDGFDFIAIESGGIITKVHDKLLGLIFYSK